MVPAVRANGMIIVADEDSDAWLDFWSLDSCVVSKTTDQTENESRLFDFLILDPPFS